MGMVDEVTADRIIAKHIVTALRSMSVPNPQGVVALNLGEEYANLLTIYLLRVFSLEEALRFAGPLKLAVSLVSIREGAPDIWEDPDLKAKVNRFKNKVDLAVKTDEGFRDLVLQLEAGRLDDFNLLALQAKQAREVTRYVDTSKGQNNPPRNIKGKPIVKTPVAKPVVEELNFEKPSEWGELRTKFLGMPKPPKDLLQQTKNNENKIVNSLRDLDSPLYSQKGIKKQFQELGLTDLDNPQMMTYLTAFTLSNKKLQTSMSKENFSLAQIGEVRRHLIQLARQQRKEAKKGKKARAKERKNEEVELMPGS